MRLTHSSPNLHFGVTGKTGAFRPIPFTGSEAPPKPEYPPLIAAVMTGKPQEIEGAFKKGGRIDEEYTETYFFPSLFGLKVTNQLNALHVLANKVHTPDPKAIKLLTDKGLNINARESETQWTPLHRYLYQYPTAKGTQNLIDAGAHVKAVDKDGSTALHLYADRITTSPRVDVFKTMVENGLDIHAKNNRGKTALDILLARGNKPDSEIVKYVISTGKTEAERSHLRQFAAETYQKRKDKLEQERQRIITQETQTVSKELNTAEAPKSSPPVSQAPPQSWRPFKHTLETLNKWWNAVLKFLHIKR